MVEVRIVDRSKGFSTWGKSRSSYKTDGVCNLVSLGLVRFQAIIIIFQTQGHPDTS